MVVTSQSYVFFLHAAVGQALVRPAAVLQVGPVKLSVLVAVHAALLRTQRWRPVARRWLSDRGLGAPNTDSAAESLRANHPSLNR
jgi:hypothetical protein